MSRPEQTMRLWAYVAVVAYWFLLGLYWGWTIWGSR